MTSDNLTVKIFSLYHKPYQLLESEIITPLHVGRAVAHLPSKDYHMRNDRDFQWMTGNMIGDDTGDNISARNRNYCELTGIYWVWKNYDKIGNPDFIGFMHYRRHFIFNEDVYDSYIPHNDDERAYSKYTVGNIYDGYAGYFGLTDDKIRECCKNYDCIIPKNCNLQHIGISSIREDYIKRIEGTHEEDFETLLTVVKTSAPAYYDAIMQRASATDKLCSQSFILKRELFFEYCSFLFGILNILDKKIDVTGYSVNGQRTIGYLGELLYDCYMYKLKKDNKITYKELGQTFLCADSIPVPVKKQTAIILLAYADYEALEISLAALTLHLPSETKLFILQNGRGTYDCERTLRVAQRYENLFPGNVKVIDFIPPQKPYFAIRDLINSKELEGYEYICKVDDDSFPLTADWFEKLCECYEFHYARHGGNLAYVSPLVNNNPFGFKQLIANNKDLSDEYFLKIARIHKVDVDGGVRIIPKEEIVSGVCGTIWRYGYIARWVHLNTTLNPAAYIRMTSSLSDVEAPNEERYSINCILFKKSYWNEIASAGENDDEHLCLLYCKANNKKIIVRQSVPFVHLTFFIQREENRDLIPVIRDFYQTWLDIPYPISMCPVKEYEIENRLRFVENAITELKVRKKPRFVNRVLRKVFNLFFPMQSRRRQFAKRIFQKLKG